MFMEMFDGFDRAAACLLILGRGAPEGMQDAFDDGWYAGSSFALLEGTYNMFNRWMCSASRGRHLTRKEK